jgi:hypothetical protein
MTPWWHHCSQLWEEVNDGTSIKPRVCPKSDVSAITNFPTHWGMEEGFDGLVFLQDHGGPRAVGVDLLKPQPADSQRHAHWVQVQHSQPS